MLDNTDVQSGPFIRRWACEGKEAILRDDGVLLIRSVAKISNGSPCILIDFLDESDERKKEHTAAHSQHECDAGEAG
jgi:hypothetical protein